MCRIYPRFCYQTPNLEIYYHLPVQNQWFCKGLSRGRSRSDRASSAHRAGKRWDALLQNGIGKNKFTRIQMESGQILGRKNPSRYLKYVTNHSVLAFPTNLSHCLDTRATEIVSLSGSLRKGWKPAWLSISLPCLNSVGTNAELGRSQNLQPAAEDSADQCSSLSS